MRALLVGLGSAGRRHLSNLRSIEPAAHITVWRQHARPQDGAGDIPGADRVVYQMDDALDPPPDTALIASPAALHVQTALALARRGIHLFIEKPLSHTLDGLDELLDECRQRALTLMVGYNFRFYRPLRVLREALKEGQIGRLLTFRAEVGQYLPDWRPGTDYRESVSARAELGGGVVLELSHELDCVRWIAGEVRTVSARVARLSDLDMDVEDTAEIILELDGGALGSVHLDMVQVAATRSCRMVGSEGILTWDGTSHQVRHFSAATRAWSDLHPAGEIDRNEMYVAELAHFLRCVREGEQPLVSGEDARRVLEIALAARRSSQEQRVITL